MAGLRLLLAALPACVLGSYESFTYPQTWMQEKNAVWIPYDDPTNYENITLPTYCHFYGQQGETCQMAADSALHMSPLPEGKSCLPFKEVWGNITNLIPQRIHGVYSKVPIHPERQTFEYCDINHPDGPTYIDDPKIEGTFLLMSDEQFAIDPNFCHGMQAQTFLNWAVKNKALGVIVTTGYPQPGAGTGFRRYEIDDFSSDHDIPVLTSTVKFGIV